MTDPSLCTSRPASEIHADHCDRFAKRGQIVGVGGPDCLGEADHGKSSPFRCRVCVTTYDECIKYDAGKCQHTYQNLRTLTYFLCLISPFHVDLEHNLHCNLLTSLLRLSDLG